MKEFDDADPDDESYRTWSVPALVTAGLGAVSWIVIFSGTLIFVPILALLLGLVTWRQFAARPGHWLGGRAAWLGVAVAVLSLGLFAGREWSQRSWLFEGARQTAEQWLRYQKEGQPLAAYEILRRPVQRLFSADALTELLAENKDEREKHAKYTRLRIIDLLQRVGPTLEWQLTRAAPQQSFEHLKYVNVIYQVTYQENGRTDSLPLEFLIERAQYPADKEPSWKIVGISSPLVPGELSP